jgi:hypothetical protein
MSEIDVTTRLTTVIVALMCASMVMQGCSSPYQPLASSPNGLGYADEKLADGVYRITLVMHLFVSPADARKLWNRRAKELCGSNMYARITDGSTPPSSIDHAIVEDIVRCSGSSVPIATIRDRVKAEGSSTASIFYVAEINGKPVANSLQATINAKRNRGLNMDPVLIKRVILAEGEVRLTLGAQTHAAAPILEFINIGKNYGARQTIRFQPKPDGVYVVTGELTGARSAVWLEDEATGEQVGTPDGSR